MTDLTCDELLTTTRSVRRRLDLTRPVPREVVEECLELAFQAPNGSNLQRWRWIVVDDPDTRAAMADINRRALEDQHEATATTTTGPATTGSATAPATTGPATTGPAPAGPAPATTAPATTGPAPAGRSTATAATATTGPAPAGPATTTTSAAAANRAPAQDPEAHARMSASVLHLIEHLQDVPVLVIPCTYGRLEGRSLFQQANVWGSILPAAWSFMLALRSRGLGSAWTTLHLRRAEEMAELLGIPHDKVTQAGLFPVAYTIGTDFRPADRAGSAEAIRWNHW